jgi:hypothetical protein
LSALDRSIRLLVTFATASMVGFSSAGDGPPPRPEHMARVVLDQDGMEQLVLTVHGQRIKDGRLRFVGSVDRPEGGLLVHWDLLCDPNPHGSASIDGVYDVVGPFNGSIRLDLPLDPIVKGQVALQATSSMRARSDEDGVAFAVGSGESAWSVVVDGRTVLRHGRGPFSIERRTAGVTGTRTWSTGEAEHEAPVVVEQARDTLSIRSSCILEPGCSVSYNGRVRLFGDPASFVFREDVASEEDDSVIPRRSGEITIVVPGAGRGSVRRNKPPAVVRPSRTPPGKR